MGFFLLRGGFFHPVQTSDLVMADYMRWNRLGGPNLVLENPINRSLKFHLD